MPSAVQRQKPALLLGACNLSDNRQLLSAGKKRQEYQCTDAIETTVCGELLRRRENT